MSRGFDPYDGYGTSSGGGRKPANKGRFSSENQPNRKPVAMPPRATTTPVELDRRKVPVKLSDGREVFERADQLMRKTLVQRAINGDMRAAAEVYRHHDAEVDAWMAAPRYKVRRRKIDSGAFLPIYYAAMPERAKLLELGLIGMLTGTDFCVMPWVSEAFERHQRALAADREVRRA